MYSSASPFDSQFTWFDRSGRELGKLGPAGDCGNPAISPDGKYGLTGSAVLFGAIYLLVHGAVKVVLVIALLLNKLWAYPCLIVVLLIFIGYQLYRIALDPSPGLIALTIFDTLIVALTWREYRRQRRTPDDHSSGTGSAAKTEAEKS